MNGRTRTPVVLMATGLLLVMVAVPVGLRAARPATSAAAERFPDVGVAENIYEPGHTSGWHTHPGMHSAVVLSGTLTVYDAQCQRQDFRAGEIYLGGREPHIAINHTLEPIRMAVTYAYTMRTALDHATVVPAPLGCIT